MTDERKTCTKCQEQKPRSEFSTRTSKGRSYQLGQCKACERLRGTSRLREVIEDRLFETYAEYSCVKAKHGSFIKPIVEINDSLSRL